MRADGRFRGLSRVRFGGATSSSVTVSHSHFLLLDSASQPENFTHHPSPTLLSLCSHQPLIPAYSLNIVFAHLR